MAYQCTCIKNIFDVHVQTKVHLSWTVPLYSNSGLYIKIHLCRGLTHQNSNFLLFFPDPDALWLRLRPLCIFGDYKSITIFIDQVTELVLSMSITKFENLIYDSIVNKTKTHCIRRGYRCLWCRGCRCLWCTRPCSEPRCHASLRIKKNVNYLKNYQHVHE